MSPTRASLATIFASFAGFAALAGCGAPPAAPLDAAAAASAPPVAAAALPLTGLGPGRHGAPCAAAPHRQFDFWLGSWNVFDPAGDQVGTNVVTAGLDGCAVEEHWTDAAGGRGRSLNAYDPQTGQWHQTWVAEGLGHLRMAGGLDGAGRMVLAGTRIAAASGVELQDRYVWTPLGPDRVRQQGTLDIPARDLHFSFDGLYVRAATVTPAPSPGSASCQPGGAAAASRAFDFALGRWAVEIEGGPPLAGSEITGDLSGCLFEENLRAPLGYAARSYLYYDPTVRRWFQTLVDNRAGRFELGGELSGGRLTLTAAGPDPLRVSWEALGPDALRQRWEITLDGGRSWIPALQLRYRRR